MPSELIPIAGRPSTSMLARQASPWAFILAAGLLVGISGCSSLAQDIYAHGAGWRTALLVQVAPADQIERRALTDCRGQTMDTDGRKYAVVEYRSGARLHVHILPADESSEARVGDTVYVNVMTCDATFSASPPTRPR